MDESGFELAEEGDWEGVVGFCQDIAAALEAAGVEGHARFEAWRPKEGEPRQGMEDRTVEEASIGTTQVERESDGLEQELSRAGGQMRDSGSELVQGNARASAKKAGAAGNSTAKGLLPMLVRLVRELERGIYRHIVEPANPDYFEAASFSASIERRLLRGGTYRCRVIFADEEEMAAVAELLED